MTQRRACRARSGRKAFGGASVSIGFSFFGWPELGWGGWGSYGEICGAGRPEADLAHGNAPDCESRWALVAGSTHLSCFGFEVRI